MVLSSGGWVRSAKGHEIDPRALQYKTGDAFQAAVRGQSLQLATFLDTTGRTYSLPAHSLPSARGLGEPLAGRLNPPDGAKFTGVMMGDPKGLWLLASDAAYGFTARLEDLITDRKAGKAVLSVPEGALALPPSAVTSDKALVCIAVVDGDGENGRLLAFPVSDASSHSPFGSPIITPVNLAPSGGFRRPASGSPSPRADGKECAGRL